MTRTEENRRLALDIAARTFGPAKPEQIIKAAETMFKFLQDTAGTRDRAAPSDQEENAA